MTVASPVTALSLSLSLSRSGIKTLLSDEDLFLAWLQSRAREVNTWYHARDDLLQLVLHFHLSWHPSELYPVSPEYSIRVLTHLTVSAMRHHLHLPKLKANYTY